MDITDIFRSYVSRAKLQRNLLGAEKTQLKFKGKRDDFNSKAKDVVYHITKLREYLLKNKDLYVDIHRPMASGFHMSNSFREKIDCTARNILKNCSSLLKDLATFAEKNSFSVQLQEHRKGVLDIVHSNLRNVCKLYDGIRDTFTKRQNEYSHMIRVSISDYQKPKEEGRQIYFEESLESSANLGSIVEELTDEELQMFEVENEGLINELNTLKGEVKAIEQKVTHIAGIQETFTELVLQQDLDIQRIDSRLIGSTENVLDANTELRKAVQNNANFRVYVLFFILMCSFTLLFLNWYND